VTFIDLPPDHAEIVDNRVQAWITDLDERHNANEAELNAAFNANQRPVELYRLNQTFRAERAKEIQIRSDCEKHYLMLKKVYDDAKEKFDNKVAKCLTIFRKRISTLELMPVEEMLRDHQYRNAWNKLNDFYQASNSGREGRSSVMSMVSTATWSGYNLHEHIDSMQVLFDQCDVIGYHLNEDLRYEYLTKSITRCAKCPQPYVDVISQYGNMPQEVTYQQLVDALQTKYNSLAIAKQLRHSIDSANYNANNTNTNNYSSSNAYLNMATVVEPGKHYSEQKVHYVHNLSSNNNSNSSKLICKNCHKAGHTKDYCWLLKTCELCGKRGHISRYCPDNENGTAEINAALNSVAIKHSSKKDKDKNKSKEVNPQKSFRHKFPKK
jgi:hypothetical protein